MSVERCTETTELLGLRGAELTLSSPNSTPAPDQLRLLLPLLWDMSDDGEVSQLRDLNKRTYVFTQRHEEGVQ